MRPSDFLKHPIAFHRVFVEITGTVTAALFLSQALYWTRRTDDGWFYKSQEEWDEETGMGRREQETARKALKTVRLIDERLDRLQHRMWYKVNLDRLDEMLSGGSPEWRNPPSLCTPPNGGKSHSSNRSETTPETTVCDDDFASEFEPMNQYIEAFNRFWATYPKKKAKPAALKAFKTKKLHTRMLEIMPPLEKHIASGQWKKNGGQYIPNPATWINEERWNDEIENYQEDRKVSASVKAVAEGRHYGGPKTVPIQRF